MSSPDRQPEFKTMLAPQQLRVFISSPGDVAYERNLARELLKDKLPVDPFLRSKVTFDPISWDDPAAPTPMVATLTPQEAVIRFGCRPSECDIVIVVLWSRLGTHLDLSKFQKPNGEPYCSGTEYEYEDAASAEEPPTILVYRRTDRVLIDADDPEHDAKMEQRKKVKAFFDRFKNPDGSYRGGFTDYPTPTEFEKRLENDLRRIVQRILQKQKQLEVAPPPLPTAADVESLQLASPVWTGPPYPGLRPFNINEASIFFGREREIETLIARLHDPNQHFLAVVAVSGRGKSSLVQAGLLPALQQGAIQGSTAWPVVPFKPGNNPFLGLASALDSLPQGTVGEPNLAEALANTPAYIIKYADQALTEAPTSARLILFVDQLEELFTQTAEVYYKGFVDLLWNAAKKARALVIATLREDFIPKAREHPRLAELLQPDAIFPLFPPGRDALADMIRRPAQRANVELEDELVNQILDDAGPDALPLVAFCLKEMYQPDNRSTPAHRMTVSAYERMGKLHGAIGKHAESLLEHWQRKVGGNIDATIETIFEALVTIDIKGKAFHRRARRNELHAVNNLVEELISGRLLIGAKFKDGFSEYATVELADDTLCDTWPRLKHWIVRNRSHMVLWAELEHDVNKWRQTYDNGLLWRGRRLKEAKGLLRCWPKHLQSSDITVDHFQQFISASRRRTLTAFAAVVVATLAVAVIPGVLLWFVITPIKTMPGTSFPKNDFNLYNMLGNAWEWTEDCLNFTPAPKTDSSAPKTDSSAPKTDSSAPKLKVCLARGGSWDNYEEWKVRPAYQLPLTATHHAETVGFRVVREVDDGERGLPQGTIVQDCKNCPEDCPKINMAILQGVWFVTRAPPSETDSCEKEKPQGTPTKLEPFAIGIYEVTVAEWDACVKKNSCEERPSIDDLPVTNVSWYEADKYVKWLSDNERCRTGHKYRLPSGVQWEYAARGGTDTCRYWGNQIDSGKANCAACGVLRERFRYWLWLRVKAISDWFGYS